MKRDLDLVRAILLLVEEKEDCRAKVFAAGQATDAELYHVQLLLDAELLKEVGTVRSSQKRKVQLTWQGHDYLDAVRDDQVWNRTKEAIRETSGSTALELVKLVAIGFAKTKIAKHTGIEI